IRERPSQRSSSRYVCPLFCTPRSTSAISTLSLHDALPILTLLQRFREEQDGRERRAEVVCEIHDEIEPVRAGQNGLDLVVDLARSEEHTSELQSRFDLVCRLLLEKKKRRRW